jgi:hypothetical protein
MSFILSWEGFPATWWNQGGWPAFRLLISMILWHPEITSSLLVQSTEAALSDNNIDILWGNHVTCLFNECLTLWHGVNSSSQREFPLGVLFSSLWTIASSKSHSTLFVLLYRHNLAILHVRLSICLPSNTTVHILEPNETVGRWRCNFLLPNARQCNMCPVMCKGVCLGLSSCTILRHAVVSLSHGSHRRHVTWWASREISPAGESIAPKWRKPNVPSNFLAVCLLHAAVAVGAQTKLRAHCTYWPDVKFDLTINWSGAGDIMGLVGSEVRKLCINCSFRITTNGRWLLAQIL